MKLKDFLLRCKKLIDENPQALDMEMVTSDGSSGAVEPMSNPYITELSSWDNSEMPVREMIPSDYPYDSVISVYIGT